jgi:hypothetical protein
MVCAKVAGEDRLRFYSEQFSRDGALALRWRVDHRGVVALNGRGK